MAMQLIHDRFDAIEISNLNLRNRVDALENSNRKLTDRVAVLEQKVAEGETGKKGASKAPSAMLDPSVYLTPSKAPSAMLDPSAYLTPSKAPSVPAPTNEIAVVYPDHPGEKFPEVMTALREALPEKTLVVKKMDELVYGQVTIAIVYPSTERWPPATWLTKMMTAIKERVGMNPLLLLGYWEHAGGGHLKYGAVEVADQTTFDGPLGFLGTLYMTRFIRWEKDSLPMLRAWVGVK